MNKNITLYHKYLKFKTRFDKTVQNGRFARFTARKRQMLIKRLERLKRQLNALNLNWKKGLSTGMLASALAFTGNVGAQEISKSGEEFVVNTLTNSDQLKPSVASDTAGNFVVVWEDTTLHSIFAQRYDVYGNTQGEYIEVENYTTATLNNPSVAMDADGDFVVVYETNKWLNPNEPEVGNQVEAKKFSSDGELIKEILVTGASMNNINPAVAMDATGGFVIVWDCVNCSQLSYQTFDADGNSLIRRQDIENDLTGLKVPDVAMNADGDFVIAWQGITENESDYDVFAQRFDAVGVAKEEQFVVNTEITNNQTNPAVAIARDGDFVIAWEDDLDADNNAVYAKTYNELGEVQKNDFVVKQGGTSNNRPYFIEPDVAMDADGNFVVVWRRYDIYAQRFNSLGEAQGEEYASTFQSQYNYTPSVAMDADGEFVLAWAQEWGDNSGTGILAHRFNYPGAPVFSPVVDQVVEISTELELNITAQDINADELTFSLDDVSKDLGMTIDESTGDFSWEPVFDDIGNHNVTVKVSDGELNTEITFQVTVYSRIEDLSSVTASPNPASTHLNVFVGDIPSIENYRILTLAGEEVEAGTWTEMTLSIRNLEEGSFQLELTSSFWSKTLEFEKVDYTDFAESSFPKEGGEQEISNDDNHVYNNVEVATDSLGNYIVVWEDQYETLENSIYAQRYNGLGVEIGNEINISEGSGVHLRNPSVALDADGDFVIAYETDELANDYTNVQVVAKLFDAQGDVVKSFGVSNNSGTCISPSVSMDADGEFAIAWEIPNNSVYIKRYTAEAETKDGFNRIFGNDGEMTPAIAMDTAGNFAVAWQTLDSQEEYYDIYVQVFNAQGSVIYDKQQVNDLSLMNQSVPSIAINAKGDFVVTWQSDHIEGGTIYAKVYNAQAEEQKHISVNYDATPSSAPKVSMDRTGGFVITWEHYNEENNSTEIYANRFNLQGDALGLPELINTTIEGDQFSPSVALDADGDFVIAWLSKDQTTTDNSVFAQRFVYPKAPSLEAIQDIVVDAGTEIKVEVKAADSNQDELTYNLDDNALAIGMTINEVTGEFSWTPTKEDAGTYEVTLTVSDGELETTATFTITVNTVQSVSNQEFAQISISPNPTSDQLNISFGDLTVAEQYNIVDVSGRTVQSGRVNASDASINVNQLEAGIYKLIISGGNWTKSIQFAKED